MESKIRTKARVKILLEISLSDTWGGDCPLSQVHKQAKDSAMNIVSQRIASSERNIRIVGKPEAVAIMVEE